MIDHDGIVQRVISLSKLPGAGHRHEIEKELQDHLEDIVEEARSQDCDDVAISRIVKMRFGSPPEVAAAFARVYARERMAHCAVGLTILLVASLATVSIVIGTVQSIVAIGTDTSIASTFNDVRFEALGFAAIALGYCSLYVGEHLFPASLAKIILLSSILAFCIGGGLSWVAPRLVILPVVAFTAAALSRLLQRVPIPLLWLAGTAAPR